MGIEMLSENGLPRHEVQMGEYGRDDIRMKYAAEGGMKGRGAQPKKTKARESNDRTTESLGGTGPGVTSFLGTGIEGCLWRCFLGY